MLMRWLKDPFCHFAAIGLLLFAIYGLRSQAASSAPSAADSDEALLVRKARELGLDRSDPVIERRLLQKMEFLIEDMASSEVPTEEELGQVITSSGLTNQEPRVSLRHVFIEPSRWDEPEEHAASVLSDIENGASPDGVGDPFVRGNTFKSLRIGDIDAILGAGMSEVLAKVSRSTWTGPWRSPYGLHLVMITDDPPRDVSEEEIVGKALVLWRKSRVEELRRDYLRSLRADGAATR